MKSIKALYIIPAVLIAMTLTACDSDDDYIRADEPAMSDSGVYFPNSNSAEIFKTDEDAREVDIIVKRGNTSGQLTVPVEVVSKTSNIGDVPSEVTFADGSDVATITISYTDLTTTPKCELRIPEAYTNPYIIKDGSSKFAFYVFKLKTIASKIVYKALFDEVKTSQLLQYEGENKFLWRNFLGSGVDLKFKINGNFDPSDINRCYGEIVPLDHYKDDGEGWYFVDDDNQYMRWTAEGASYSIENYIFFWNQYDGYNYNRIDLDFSYSPNAYFYSACIDAEDAYYSFFAYFYN